MGKVLNRKTYPCRIATTGVIHEMGCITGPIPFCLLDDSQIELLVKNGKEVYEKCPDNLSVEVRLHVSDPLVHPFEQPVEKPEEEKIEALAEESPVVEAPVQEEVDLSKMSKKQKKEYFKKLAQEKEAALASATESEAQETDPVTPDA